MIHVQLLSTHCLLILTSSRARSSATEAALMAGRFNCKSADTIAGVCGACQCGSSAPPGSTHLRSGGAGRVTRQRNITRGTYVSSTRCKQYLGLYICIQQLQDMTFMFDSNLVLLLILIAAAQNSILWRNKEINRNNCLRNILGTSRGTYTVGTRTTV
jgi:hypothetical protein